jgi:hypothetical protein
MSKSPVRILLIVCFSLLVAQVSGCSIKPWVKPYERAHLADPIMGFSRDPVHESYLSHVYESRESMRGAEGGAGGGCGCN